MAPDLFWPTIYNMMLQFLGESLHCVGMLQLCWPARLRPASDIHFSLVYHLSTVTRLSMQAGSTFS